MKENDWNDILSYRKPTQRFNICFICPGLEPGKDAVGDYTVELARRVAHTGYNVSIVALADRYVNVCCKGHRAACRTLRLPNKSTWRLRWQHFADYVREVQPQWVSLQWVAFGYQDKGLPLGFGRRLRQIVGDIPVQLMCHEIWVCADGTGSLKNRLYSRLQREVHRRCFRALAPACVHTHALPYAQALKRIGQSAKILPLGSNVHRKSDLVANSAQESSWIGEKLTFIVFGNTPPEWDAVRAVTTLSQECQRIGRRGILYFAGKGGPTGTALESLIALGKGLGLRVENLGFLEGDRVQAYLAQAQAGLATVPFALWQKSSAVAGMRTSGLPVLFTRFDGAWPKDCLPPWEAGFFRLKAGIMEQVLQARTNAGPDLWQASVRQFLADLRNDSPPAKTERGGDGNPST